MTWLPWAIVGLLVATSVSLLVHAVRSSGRAGERRGGDAEKLAAAARGEEAQNAQNRTEKLARGRMLVRAAKRIRDRLRAQESGRDG